VSENKSSNPAGTIPPSTLSRSYRDAPGEAQDSGSAKWQRYRIRRSAGVIVLLATSLFAVIFWNELSGSIAESLPIGNNQPESPGETNVADLGITSPLARSRMNQPYYQVIPLSKPPARYLETRSHRAITVGFDALDHATATSGVADYRLWSATDPGYANPVAATRVGSDRQAVGFDERKRVLIDARLHLLFPRPLKPGHDYELDISPAVPGENRFTVGVSYAPDRVSGSIQVNQVGYAPAARKFAFLGNWLGSAGPLPVDSPEFQVLDAMNGKVILQGRATLRAKADPWSGNDVWEADFSGLSRPGRYRIRVPGLGVSDAFNIAVDVYEDIYVSLMRLFYHSRNSLPVKTPWADPGFERPDGGVPPAMDGIFHETVGTSPLGRGEQAGSYHPISGGWFDAGDFGQYVPNAAPVWFQVAAGLDIAPERFRDGDLNIPESGNGIPDVLDELEWGLNWLLSMQDPTDGGVYFRIASRSWDESLPHEIDTPRVIAEKTTHATAAFAAVCALHARLIQPYRPERARQALAAALAAWQFLRDRPRWPEEGERYRNPAGIHAGEYSDASSLDNILWAAAELYRTTGETRYRQAYEQLAPSVKIDPTAGVTFKDQGMAALWAYLMAPRGDQDAILKKKARSDLIAAADWYIRKARENPFRAPVHQHIGFLGWGTFARSTRATLPLLQAYRLTGDARYLEWAWQTPNTQLGANPQSLSYITGIGMRSPLYPLSKLSQFLDSETPLQGLPVHGPQFHLPALWKEMTAVNDAYFPPEAPSARMPKEEVDYAGAYPVLRRYTDSLYLPPMSEPTIAEYAQAATAYALLR